MRVILAEFVVILATKVCIYCDFRDHDCVLWIYNLNFTGLVSTQNCQKNITQRHFSASVTRPKLPKGAKGDVERPKGPPARSRGPEGS